MLNLKEINKFVLIPAGEGLELGRNEVRVIRLELNTAGPCRLLVQHGPFDIRFLADVAGRETVELSAVGPVTIWPDCEGEVWAWTAELGTSAIRIPDAETFTKIAERKPRNLELERVAAKMAENADRRMRALEEGVNNQLRALVRENDALKTERANAPKPPADDTSANNANAGIGEGEAKRKPAKQAPASNDSSADDDAKG